MPGISSNVRAVAGLATAVTTVLAMAIPGAAAAPEPDAPDVSPDTHAKQLEAAELDTVSSATPVHKPAALGRGTEQRTYLIQLADPAVPTYTGGVPGLASTAPRTGERLQADSSTAQAYRDHLVQAQVEVIDDVEDIVGRDVEVPFTYQNALNGFAAVLTPDEARDLVDHPDIVSIELDQEHELHTDAGPQWIGADAVWNASAELGLPADYRGEGIVIGTIDTGISPGNRSFAEVGGDGYVHENPLGDGTFLGACDPGNSSQYDPAFPCNNKLIGAYVFGGANNSALDYDGHGSHTASTSGGNVVDDAVINAPTVTTDPIRISGVAPHANVISYLGCCTTSGLVASIDQAIADGVDVINYSIGSSDPGNPWADPTSIGFLNARAAGIFVATSNGNDGPGDATTGSPASSPWITSVGASTHNRQLGNAVIDLTSSEGDLPDIAGASVTGPLPSAPIVYAGDYGSPECGSGSTDNPVNDWAPGTFDGQIVVCDRGTIGRVQKAVHVLEAGGAGIIHVNDAANGDSLAADAFAVPGVHIGYDDGQALKAWLDNGATDHAGAIRGTEFEKDDSFGDLMAGFSSRGPNRAIDVITPDVTAPGVDILAAVGAGSATVDEHGIISGTSMASPHVAGAGALLTQARPDWTPAQMQSALMTTARDIRNHDGEPATPYAQGAGHINVDLAVRAGLLFDETQADYLAADPSTGGDPTTLNVPSFANSECLATCTWSRTATVPDSAPADVTWTASATTDAGLSLDVALSQSTVSPGDSVTIDVTADVAGAPDDETLFGQVVLTPDQPDVPTVTMPVAVLPTSGVLPDEIIIQTRRNAGSHVVTDVESTEVTEFTGDLTGLVPATLASGSLVQDPTNDDPYDDLDQVGVHLIEVGPDSGRLVADLIRADMLDADVRVGTGDTPSAETEVCASTSPSSDESCDIADPQAGTWWVVVQNWTGITTGSADGYELATAVVPDENLGNGGIEGPDGAVPAGEPYDVQVQWDIEDMTAGDIWYGTAVLGTSPATPGDIGSVLVMIQRMGDDVSKSASVATAMAGETVSYKLTVQPNVTPRDLNYTVTDTVPDGLTIDPESVTGGGVVDGQTIRWDIEAPTPAEAGGDYEYTTSLDDNTCASPLGGYFDLNGELGFQPVGGVDGASGLFTFLASTPFHFYGEQPAGLGVTPHGFVVQGGTYAGSPDVPQSLPDETAPNGLVAPLWADTEIVRAEGAPGTERGVTVASSAALAIVEFDRLQMAGNADQMLGSYQLVTLTEPNPRGADAFIVFDEPGFLPSEYSIGIEDAAGTRGLPVTEPLADLWKRGTTICLDFVPETFEPLTVGYDVTVDVDAASGTYTNSAVHTTDDPFAQPVTITHDLDVTAGLTSITVTPDSVRLKRTDQEQQFTATGHRSDGTTEDLTDQVTWASGDLDVVTIEPDGLATSAGGGKTTITATLGDLQASANVHVTGPPATVGPNPHIIPTTLPRLNVLEPYEATVEADRGRPPYTWSASGLPHGLVIDPDTGIITNDPADPTVTDVPSAPVTVTVTDSRGKTDAMKLRLDMTVVTKMAAGRKHTCAVTTDTTVYCWGGNLGGQLGNGTFEASHLPRPVVSPDDPDEPFRGAVDISAGTEHTCAITEAGTAYCWGYNGGGRLGLGHNDFGSITVPAQVVGPEGSGYLQDVVQISATGEIHTCALVESGTAYCWGDNYRGQIGAPGGSNGIPMQVRHPADASEPLTGLTDISTGSFHSCAVTASGTAWCWGWNHVGQLGIGQTFPIQSTRPLAVLDPSNLSRPMTGLDDISSGYVHTCAGTTSGTGYCWGQNASGQLGNGAAPDNVHAPTPVIDPDSPGDPLTGLRSLGLANLHSCATTTANTVYCWGSNSKGQLGDGTTTETDLPVVVADPDNPEVPFGDIAMVTQNGWQTCAVTTAGIPYCWGENTDGQIGDGTTEDRHLPTPVRPAAG